MQQPPDFVSHDPTLVYKLHKTICGLKETHRAWFHKPNYTLQQLDFQSTKSDSSLFVKFSNSSTIFILIYIDYIIITGSSLHVFVSLIYVQSSSFALKDLASLNYFLGIEVSRTSDGNLYLSQACYINYLLQ